MYPTGKVTCPKCGKITYKGLGYCPRCGNRIEGIEYREAK